MVTHTYQRGCCVSTNDDGPACATCEKARDELDVSPVQELYDDDVAHGIFLLVAMLAEGPRPSPLCTECRSTLVQGPQGWHCTAEATCDFCGEISHVFHLPTAHGAPDYVCVKCVKRSMFGKPASGRSVEPHPSERGADHSEIASPEQAEPTPASGPAVSGEPRTTRKEGIPHELAAEIRRAAANLANDYEMGERPCCADLARRIARGIRKLDLEAFAKASGEPRRGIPLTRVEVIDHRADSETFGRAFVAWDVAMELSYQDHGRTLKVFVDDKGALPNNPGEQAASASGANASNAESAQDGASPAGIPREPSEQAVRAAALALNNFNSDKYPWVEGSNWSVVWRDLTAALKAAYAVDSVAPAPTSEGPHESGTYGELPFSIRRMVAGHEWDNMDREQQRAWLIQRLAVSEGPLPHSPPSLLESQMYKERLLPCPFCGAAAVRRMVSVGCGNEFCRVRPNVIAKDAAEFWNVRGLPSVSDPEKR